MNKKIMIVDDKPELSKILAIGLEQFHFDVATASSGEEALKRVKQEQPDLIILDIMMPKMDGNEVAEKLQEDPLSASIPIIFLSALQTHAGEMTQGDSIAGRIVFAKPYDIKHLVAKIHELTD